MNDGLQDLSGRRECGYGGATRPKVDMSRMWAVVLALASALTDARDQLMTLMHNYTMPRMTGGCTRHTTPARAYSPYPGAGKWIRNLHRGHAHGHVAFGCSSEYRLHPSRVRAWQPRPISQPRSAEVNASQVSRSPARCRHPLHRMQVSHSSRPASRCGGLSPRRDIRGGYARRSRGSPASCNRFSASNRKNLSPDQERRCIGSEYAALLREEAYQLRERRLAKDSRRGRRPP